MILWVPIIQNYYNDYCIKLFLPFLLDVHVSQLSRVIKSVIQQHYSQLHDVVSTNLQIIAVNMFAAGLITESALLSPSFHSIIDQFISVLSFMSSLSEIEQHCTKFLSIFTDIGGPCTLVSEVLKMNWIEVSRAKYGVELQLGM